MPGSKVTRPLALEHSALRALTHVVRAAGVVGVIWARPSIERGPYCSLVSPPGSKPGSLPLLSLKSQPAFVHCTLLAPLPTQPPRAWMNPGGAPLTATSCGTALGSSIVIFELEKTLPVTFHAN